MNAGLADLGARAVGGHLMAALRRNEVRAELRGWLFLAAVSLAVAGAFAFLVAMSRIPAVVTIVPGLSGFFSKGLVVHVVFSFVVWFLTMFALLTTMGCHAIVGNNTPRLAWADAAGRVAVSLAFPFLLVPAFLRKGEAVLNNYVPVIDHPFYFVGLTLLYAGILLPVIRLFVNAAARKGPLDIVSFGMVAAGFVYVSALACMVLAMRAGWSMTAGYGFYEHIFWGSGHVLHFLNVIIVICGWIVLGRAALGADLLDPTITRTVVIVLMVFALPTPAFYLAFGANPSKLTSVFVALQYGLGPPVAIVGGATILAIGRLKAEGDGRLPWRDPAFLCLVLSMAVFGIGGIFGFAVDGSDTRTPAHYHGVIAGVNLVLMGLSLRAVLPLLGRGGSCRSGMLRTQVMLFGAGQAVACVGLFLAGGYGAPRKVAAQAGALADAAVIGMYLNGVGAMVAIAGGIMFIWTILRAVTPQGGEGLRAASVADLGA